jgi:hypothetical protein
MNQEEPSEPWASLQTIKWHYNPRTNELLLTVILLNEIINTFQFVRNFLWYKGTKSKVMTGRYRIYLLPSFFLTETRSLFFYAGVVEKK